MGGVAISATDVVAPVLAAPEVIVLFLARMTRETRLGDLFRRFVLERNDLLRIAFLAVGLAWTMTGLATRHFVLPTGKRRELRVRCVRERFELIFVTILASLTAYILARDLLHSHRRRRFFCRTRTPGVQKTNARNYRDCTDDGGCLSS